MKVVSDSGGNSRLAEFLVGSWARLRCVTNDSIRYVSTASTLGSGAVLWLKTSVQARAAAGGSSSGGQEEKSFHFLQDGSDLFHGYFLSALDA